MLYRQARTSSYAETTGTVTHSEVTRHRGSKGGTTYAALTSRDASGMKAAFVRALHAARDRAEELGRG